MGFGRAPFVLFDPPEEVHSYSVEQAVRTERLPSQPALPIGNLVTVVARHEQREGGRSRGPRGDHHWCRARLEPAERVGRGLGPFATMASYLRTGDERLEEPHGRRRPLGPVIALSVEPGVEEGHRDA